jgi:hypothetical protein
MLIFGFEGKSGIYILRPLHFRGMSRCVLPGDSALIMSNNNIFILLFI